MILFLCYVCPPLAVLLMGRPFSCVLNMFLTGFLWVPGIGHALVCYADYKSDKSINKITKAINDPHYVQAGRRAKAQRTRTVERVVYDNPHVGQNGTYFRPKR